jgi:(p)ppGpp synthase/HD superfamily hydrolase
MGTLEKAIRIAAQAHQGDKDKGGAPYILHPLRVMLKMSTKAEMITAVLHDLVEDTSWNLADLEREGFAGEVLAALNCLTRRPGEDYQEFILRVSMNPLARKVKLADLEDNLNLIRLGTLTEKDKARIERYHQAWQTLARGKKR